MPVPTTQTLVDAQADAKKLNEQNSLIRQEIDTLIGLRDNAKDSLNDIISQKDVIQSEIDSLVVHGKEVVAQVVTKVDDTIGVLKQVNDDICKYNEVLFRLGEEIERELDVLKKIEIKKQEHVNFILEETERLDTLKNNIEIYRERINSMITKYNMGLALL